MSGQPPLWVEANRAWCAAVVAAIAAPVWRSITRCPKCGATGDQLCRKPSGQATRHIGRTHV